MVSKCNEKNIAYVQRLLKWFLLGGILICCSCTRIKCSCDNNCACNQIRDSFCVAELFGVTKNVPRLYKELSFQFLVRNKTSDTVFIPLNGTIIHPSQYNYKSFVRVSLKGRSVIGHTELWIILNNGKFDINCKKKSILPPGSTAKISIELYPLEIEKLNYDYNSPTSSIITQLKFNYIFEESDRVFSRYKPINLSFIKGDSIRYVDKDWSFL